MNIVKKLASIVLSCVMTAAMFTGMAAPAFAAKTTDTLDPMVLVNYVNKKVNSSVPMESCMKFVADSVKAAYSLPVRSSAHCACCYAYDVIGKKNLKDPYNYNNIPLGADVFFSGSDVVCSRHGHCGHIGIYVGNGQIVHTWNGKVIKSTIKYVEDHHKENAAPYKYIGWGWHGNYKFRQQTSQTYYTFKNAKSGKMLNVKGNGSTSGTNVTIYQADGTTGQQFRRISTGTKPFSGKSYTKYVIEAKCASACALNVYGSASVAGNNVNLWKKSGNDTQEWIMVPVSNVANGYIIRSVNNTNCVLAANGTANSSNVQLAAYKSGDMNQVWIIPNM